MGSDDGQARAFVRISCGRFPMQQISIPLADDCPAVSEKRSMAGGLVLSGLLHGLLALIASLIVFTHLQPDPFEPLSAGFDQEGDPAESLQLHPEVNGFELTEATAVGVPEFTSVDVGAQAAGNAVRMELDLSQFGIGQTSPSSGLGEVAQGIQERVGRAGGKAGEVQFSLSWHSTNDLDLHVIAPSGEHISYQHRRSRCDGMLDVDMNVQPESIEPVENIRWLDRSAPMGRYTVLVHQYRWRSGQVDDPLELLVNLGAESQLIEDRVSASSSLLIRRFVYVKATLSQSRRKALLRQFEALQQKEESQASALLEKALAMTEGIPREQVLRRIIGEFAHTDAAIRAMQELTEESAKPRR